MVEANINTSNKIIIPSRVWGAKKEELLENLKWISYENTQRIWKEMEKTKEIRLQKEEEENKRKTREEKEKKEKEKKEREEKLKWDTDAILKDLKENHVKIEENAKMMWYKWKKVHIYLPAVWDFEWFKFDYFVSDCEVLKKNFAKKPELEKRSYSMKDVSKLFQAMNEYMSELQGKNDWNMDYENELTCWGTKRNVCNAGDCLKAITWLNVSYRLRDKEDVVWERYQRAELDCRNDCCYVYRSLSEYNYANLLLKLPD